MSFSFLVGVFFCFTLLQFVVCDPCEGDLDADTCYCSCCQGYDCSVECAGEFAVDDCSDCTESGCASHFSLCEKSANRIVDTSCHSSTGNELIFFIAFLVGGLVLVCGGFLLFKSRQRKLQQRQQDQALLSSPPEGDYQNLIQQSSSSYQSGFSNPSSDNQAAGECCGISVGGWLRNLLLYGVMIGFVVMTMGVAGHILATGPTWRQRVVQGLSSQNTYCFSKDTLTTYGTLLMIPSAVQLGVGGLGGTCCLGDCCPLGPLFTMTGLVAAAVALAEGVFFVDLGAEGAILSRSQCPFDLKGGAVRVDGFFLTPMAYTLIALCSLYVLVGVRALVKQLRS